MNRVLNPNLITRNSTTRKLTRQPKLTRYVTRKLTRQPKLTRLVTRKLTRLLGGKTAQRKVVRQ